MNDMQRVTAIDANAADAVQLAIRNIIEVEKGVPRPTTGTEADIDAKRKQQLHQLFDHTTIIAGDDPARAWFQEGQHKGLCELVILPRVGCEAFAQFVAGLATDWLFAHDHGERVHVASVTVSEHGANSARFEP